MNRVHQMINSRAISNLKLTGNGIGVAVLDSGIVRHPDFDGRLHPQKDFVRWEKGWYDDYSHGTHVAGIIGGSGKMSYGRFRGMAPECRLLSLKVLDRKGEGTVDIMLEALEWLRIHHEEYGIRLVNISVGGLPEEGRAEDSQLVQAVERLWSCGLTVVVAAGNEGPGEGTITTPGNSRKVITVGSCDDHLSLGRNLMTDYSGRGPTMECIMKPEIVAPGQMVKSCANRGNAYTMKSGTSMSAAVVTGALALLMEKEPDLTNREIKLRLYQRTADLGWSPRRQGWGMLDMGKLLR